MPEEIRFKSYCWVVGTTSFRTSYFNKTIEEQLKLLHEFYSREENQGQEWNGNGQFQSRYYRFLREKGFLKGDAARTDKDARQKTSGLKELGLLGADRNFTEAGRALLNAALSGDFAPDNLLEIPKDSFIYFRQLLKTSLRVNASYVRPFVVFLYVVSRTGYLTYEEFTYLLPLCVDAAMTERMVETILESRADGLEHGKVILDVLMGMPNYQAALELFQREVPSEELFCAVGFNRKSRRYDKPYYGVFRALHGLVFEEKRRELVPELFHAVQKLTKSTIEPRWRKYFFGDRKEKDVISDGFSAVNDVPILHAETEEEFREHFFKLMHRIKAESTLSDYFDLNRRYFRATDTVIFRDDTVTLDVLPRCYAEIIADSLEELAFTPTDLLGRDVTLEEISPVLAVRRELLYEKLGAALGRKVTGTDSARQVIRDERYRRFDDLIDRKFSREKLLKLLADFEERRDADIYRDVTYNADIPTIFEYVLGIAWYVLSGRKGDVLEYMNLSLEADLLPRTHAGGGEADIVWQYPAAGQYPAHTLLLEATLADKNTQRRMEMEPVSRHLGDYRLKHRDREAYCTFVTTHLNVNVISDFRQRRYGIYYNSIDETDYVEGLKICPLETAELKKLLAYGVSYEEFYALLERAWACGDPPAQWYRKRIREEIDRIRHCGLAQNVL